MGEAMFQLDGVTGTDAAAARSSISCLKITVPWEFRFEAKKSRTMSRLKEERDHIEIQRQYAQRSSVDTLSSLLMKMTLLTICCS